MSSIRLDGGHLRELEAKFADVGFSSTESDLSQPIEKMKNLGPKSGQWLREVGITTIGELERIGRWSPIGSYGNNRRTPGLNLLWALAGGFEGFRLARPHG